jgi:nucleoside-triphosphatase THEP1
MTRRIVVVDEIGPMEVLSSEFKSTVSGIITNPSLAMFGTIVQRQCDFADELKVHPRVTLIDVTRENRNGLRAVLHSLLAANNPSPKHQRERAN